MVMDLRYGELAEGLFGLGIHRAALFRTLHDALTRTSAQILFGFDVVSIRSTARPCLVARDGREAGPFDLVLDCAGAHDTLRDQFSHRLTAPIYPWGALWTTCRDTTNGFGGQLRQLYRGANTMIGVLPVGRVPDAPDDHNHVAFFWSLKLADFERLRTEGLESLKAKVLRVWPHVAPLLAEITRFEDLSLATYRDVRLKPWREGRVIALGDAAHATSPQLGQGANLALIDAVTFAQALEGAADVDRALADYEKSRRPHVRFYQWASRTLTPFFQSDSHALGFARDLALGPLGQLPVMDKIMRTTLAGIRLFPFGLCGLPPISNREPHAAMQTDEDQIGNIAGE
jgi:2-polyprenyl-6-methoxyphenol hydroxylase-like FAD-dependent oxidoreductase